MRQRISRRAAATVVACLSIVLLSAGILYHVHHRLPQTGIVPLTYKGPITRVDKTPAPAYGPGWIGGASEAAGANGIDGSKAAQPGAMSAFDLPALIEDEELWLKACQLKDGAIAQTPEGQSVVPYFANIAAKVLVDIDPARARLYMTWYIQHMNRPDRYGLTGTIYDYEMTLQGLAPTFNYDSADSYAATFLTLASYYLEQTGDRRFIVQNLDSIDLAASVILSLQDADGLVVFSPNSRTKFLMDNNEAYRGLLDWADALDSLGMHARASSYRDSAMRIRSGIQTVLYDPARQDYAWSLTRLGKRLPKRSVWYPDNISQLDLIIYGVMSPDDPRAQKIWRDFNDRFPGWAEGEGVERDGFPWAKVAQAAALVGDTVQAKAFLQWADEEFAREGHPYPWHVSESAMMIEVGRMLDPLENPAPAAGPELASGSMR